MIFEFLTANETVNLVGQFALAAVCIGGFIVAAADGLLSLYD